MSESNSSNDYTPLDEALAEYVMRTDRGEAVDREEFIASHPELADELRAYFADADAVDQMLDSAAESMAGAATGAETPLKKVRYFGDYELLEEIGRGGMGVVYKAMQTSLMRTVAVKMILGGRLSRGDEVDRFRREAAAAAQLKHRSIVAIHEVGEYEGHHYFSMDYIAGHSLDAIVRQNPLAPRRAAGYLRLIAEAIECAHKQGILHRDLKPSNVLIDANDVPVVTDFGLAKLVESDSDLTSSGMVLGSPSYMPPEQALGNTKVLRVTSDVYSLGATFYEMLTGRPPFRAESPTATIYQVVHSEVVSPRMLNPAIDRDVETICLKCLEKDATRRYETAEALAGDLGRYLEGRPIVARPVSRPARLWRWCKRNPTVAALTAAIFTLLVVGTVVSTLLAIAAHREATRATNEAERATAAEKKTLREAAAREIESIRRLAERGDWRAVLTGLDSPALAYHDDPVQRALWRVEAFSALNQHKKAADAIEKLAASNPGGKHAGEILLWQGDVLRLKDAERSRRLIERALHKDMKLPPADAAYAEALLKKTVPESTELLEKAVASQPLHHRANAMLAMNLAVLGRTEEAKSRAAGVQCIFPQDPSFPVVLALAALIDNKPNAVERHLRELERLLDKEQMDDFRAMFELGTRWRAALDKEDGSDFLEVCKDMLPLLVKAPLFSRQGADDRSAIRSSPPQLATALSKYLEGITCFIAGSFIPDQKNAAIAAMAEAAEILPIAPFQIAHADLLVDQGRFEEAGKAFKKAAQGPEFVRGLRLEATAHAGFMQLFVGKQAGEKGKAISDEGFALCEESLKLGSPPPVSRGSIYAALLRNNRATLRVHELLEREHAKDPKKPNSLLAWSCQIQGEYYRGLKLAEEALKANPKDERAKKVREECLRLLKSDPSLK
jgi:serine/threonine protein kinase